jgi:hypothetical protein
MFMRDTHSAVSSYLLNLALLAYRLLSLTALESSDVRQSPA